MRTTAVFIGGVFTILSLACNSASINSRTIDASEQEFIDMILDDPDLKKVSCTPEQWLVNEHPIEFYTQRLSYMAGEYVSFFVHSPKGPHEIAVNDLASNGPPLHYRSGVFGYRQDYKCYDYSWGLTWESTYGLMLPPDMKSGIYAVSMTDGSQDTAYSAFIVRPVTATSNIVFLAGTNTWAAYNDWGGGSFYTNKIEEETPTSTIVSFRRPNTALEPFGLKGHLLEADRHLLQWLRTHEYDFDVLSDADVHDNPDRLAAYTVAILGGHSEYWTEAMVMGMRNFVNQGGNLIVVGANAMYWKVALKYDRIEVRKNGSNFAYTSGHGGLWRDLGYPEAALAGVAYDSRGYNTYAPYNVQENDHWVFTNTGLAKGDPFGIGDDGIRAASGHETDKMTGDSPAQTVLLAQGTNPDSGGAHMVIVPGVDGSGQVFSTGSITFSEGLQDATSSASLILQNVLQRFLMRP